MKARIAVLIFLVCPFGALAAASTRGDVWVPRVEFELEQLNYKEILVWISGYSYALTALSKIKPEKGYRNALCLDGNGYIGSRFLLHVLNARYKGHRITAAQASSALIEAVRKRYACEK